MSVGNLFIAYLVLALLGLAGCMVPRDRVRTILITASALLQSVALIACGILVLIHQRPVHLALWRLGPADLSFDITPMGSLFVIIAAVVFACCYAFAASTHETELGEATRPNRAFLTLFQVFYLAIILVLVAGDVLTFAFWWEVVSGLIYALVLFEHAKARSVRAAYSTLAMSEVGSLAGVIGLLTIAASSGHLGFADIVSSRTGPSETARWLIFLLTFFGFGVKAGLVPVNQWLPDTHTVAPRSLSPVLSGATLNLGIYAILLVSTKLAPVEQVGPGIVALIMGGLGAIIGIIYAATQSDLKRALAHSSIENMGIVLAGIGAGLIFWDTGHAVLAGMAFIAALYHMANHSVYKSLLFVGAGAIEASTKTHDLNQLGGLRRQTPAMAFLFFIGTLSIAAVPPFNGFVSEWLTLQSVLRSVELSSRSVRLCFVLTGALLALAAGLALTCFLMIYASGFLGMPHSDAAQTARRAPRSAIWGMGALALLCLLLGIGPTYVIPSLDRVVSPITHTGSTEALVPNFFHVTPRSPGNLSPGFVSDFHDLGAQVGHRVLPGRGLVVLHQGGSSNPVVFAMSTAYTLVVLALVLFLTYIVFQALTRARNAERRNAWAGGLPRLLPQMTYSFTGLSAPVRVIFETVFKPLRERKVETVGGHFRTAIRVEETQEHILDRLLTRPILACLLWIANQFRKMHRGQVNVYAAYVLLSLLAALLFGTGSFSVPRDFLLKGIFP
jgi:hydrogenase-4 component B